MLAVFFLRIFLLIFLYRFTKRYENDDASAALSIITVTFGVLFCVYFISVCLCSCENSYSDGQFQPKQKWLTNKELQLNRNQKKTLIHHINLFLGNIFIIIRKFDNHNIRMAATHTLTIKEMQRNEKKTIQFGSLTLRRLLLFFFV